ncbi:hypothetical protein [endosymbiont GvMRE of Glomus versiforme]|uniref:hypothetical protein n=1 Tax=endosymbiont GvMRE of Glomus versiforme TaxID=2039283 RepID=UPI000ED7C91C|nr:hypothetical protein [endosymbiont GvMRE of Glomus versiforme]RHZ35578.1 hypothetical protein GvMRE_IIg331 [endosymbiont GvMRE of Glomus versiforme]
MNMRKFSKNLQKSRSSTIWPLMSSIIILLVLSLVFFSYSKSNNNELEPSTKKINKTKKKMMLLYNNDDHQILAHCSERRRKIWRKLSNPSIYCLTQSRTDELKQEILKTDKNACPFYRIEKLKKIEDSIMKPKLIRERFYEVQKNWLRYKLFYEIKELWTDIDKLMKTFYHRSIKEIRKQGEVKSDWEESIDPKIFKGKIISSTKASEYLKYFQSNFQQLREFQVKFKGFKGFIVDKKEKKTVKQGATFTSDKKKLVYEGLVFYDKDENNILKEVSYYDSDKTSLCYYKERTIEIKLRKELLFNRKGYQEWITNVQNEEKTIRWNSSDISWDKGILETIAHELAHALIDSILINYNNYEKTDGEHHGPLHKKYTFMISEMIMKSAEGRKFKKIWNKN